MGLANNLEPPSTVVCFSGILASSTGEQAAVSFTTPARRSGPSESPSGSWAARWA